MMRTVFAQQAGTVLKWRIVRSATFCQSGASDLLSGNEYPGMHSRKEEKGGGTELKETLEGLGVTYSLYALEEI